MYDAYPAVNGLLGLSMSKSLVLSQTKGDAKSKRSNEFWGQNPGFCGASGVKMLASAKLGLADTPPPPFSPWQQINLLFKTKTKCLRPGCLSASWIFPANRNFVVGFVWLLASLFPDTPYSQTYFFQDSDFFGWISPTPTYIREGATSIQCQIDPATLEIISRA